MILGGILFSQSKWADHWLFYAISQPSTDQVGSPFVDRSASLSEVDEPTPMDEEDENLVVKQEAEEVPEANEPSHEEQAIGQKPESQAIEHKVAKISLPDVKTVPAITVKDINVSLISARRDMKPWGSSEEDLRGRGKLVIRLDNRIKTIEEPLQFRFASKPWRQLKQTQNLYSAILEPQELDHGNLLEVAVGDADVGSSLVLFPIAETIH